MRNRLKDVVPGTIIDARDTEYIWCKGKVIKVVSYTGSLQSLLIHYEVSYCLTDYRDGVLFMMNI